MEEPVFSVSDFVAVVNQTLEFAYPSVLVQGELANFRVSKNRWVYFDLKDDYSSVKFFGTVYQMPGPLEDGMLVEVRGLPRLHPQYNFSVNVQSIRPVGEGSLKKAAALLKAKLAKEGLFDDERKRPLSYPPRKIGLIASSESAAYRDFIKIINHRWAGLEIQLADVAVQGETATGQIVSALDYFNTHGDELDVIVITRGGGSPEDLAAFSTEQVTRAVAASRIPTLVAIGHETDISLAELAADRRASTPSNSAELLVPDKKSESGRLMSMQDQLGRSLLAMASGKIGVIKEAAMLLDHAVNKILESNRQKLKLKSEIIEALNPEAALMRGYAIIRSISGSVIRSGKQINIGDDINVALHDATLSATVKGKL